MTDPRLQRLLGGPALAALRLRLRQRFAALPEAALPAPFRLARLQADEHAALAGLLGRPGRPSASMAVDLAEIDAALQRAGLAPSLRAALEALDGPIVDTAQAQAVQAAGWAALAAAARHPALAAWLGSAAGLGLLKRLARSPGPAAARWVAQADAVLQRLPAAGLARAELAAGVLGDAHALDRGAPLATLVLAALRSARRAGATDELAAEPAGDARADVAGEVAGDDMSADTPADAPEREREVWAGAGVLVNELARPALMLNLPLADGDLLLAGEPTYLSLRRLLRAPPAWGLAGRAVFVCENPNLVAIAADRLGDTCAPLVCTDGMPAAAQRVLLLQLAAAGASLHYHGDFDWPGLRIANQVRAVCGGSPPWQAWRFSADDYGQACQASAGRPLTGTPAAAGWDSGLAAAMAAAGLAIDEEALADSLLGDLAR